jgi:RNA polymerase sigma-70 factor (ECF subfamily)
VLYGPGRFRHDSPVEAQQLSCSEIAHRIQGGDRDAEAELSRRFTQGITQIVVKLTGNYAIAQELCQETLIILLTRLRTKPLEDPEKLPAFVAQIARNLVISERRKTRRRKTEVNSEMVEQASDDTPDQVEDAQRESAAAAIRTVLSEMKSTRDRVLLVRYYLHDEDKRVICRDLGLSESSFNVVLFRARARFLELLQKHGLQGRDFMSFVLL